MTTYDPATLAHLSLLERAKALRARLRTGPDLVTQEVALQGCKRCGLCESRTSIVFGRGPAPAHVLVVGEGPGEAEDLAGVPFAGRGGDLLTCLLARAGIDPVRDCYLTNVVKCRPAINRNPTPGERTACWPFLLAQVEAVDPLVILALGNYAAQSFLRTDDGITRVRGLHVWRGVPLVATFHPAFLLRNPGTEYREMVADDLRLLAAQIRAATLAHLDALATWEPV